MIWGSGSRKLNVSLNLINSQPDIDKIYLYAKDPYEAKYQLSFNNGVIAGLKYSNDSKSLLNTQMICKIFIKYWRIQSRKES